MQISISCRSLEQNINSHWSIQFISRCRSFIIAVQNTRRPENFRNDREHGVTTPFKMTKNHPHGSRVRDVPIETGHLLTRRYIPRFIERINLSDSTRQRQINYYARNKINTNLSRSAISSDVSIFLINLGWSNAATPSSPMKRNVSIIKGNKKRKKRERMEEVCVLKYTHITHRHTHMRKIIKKDEGERGSDEQCSSWIYRAPGRAEIVKRPLNANGKALRDRVDECPHYTNTASYSTEINRVHYSLALAWPYSPSLQEPRV